jgi:hypothetical protein
MGDVAALIMRRRAPFLICTSQNKTDSAKTSLFTFYHFQPPRTSELSLHFASVFLLIQSDSRRKYQLTATTPSYKSLQ